MCNVNALECWTSHAWSWARMPIKNFNTLRSHDTLTVYSYVCVIASHFKSSIRQMRKRVAYMWSRIFCTYSRFSQCKNCYCCSVISSLWKLVYWIRVLIHLLLKYNRYFFCLSGKVFVLKEWIVKDCRMQEQFKYFGITLLISLWLMTLREPKDYILAHEVLKCYAIRQHF